MGSPHMNGSGASKVICVLWVICVCVCVCACPCAGRSVPVHVRKLGQNEKLDATERSLETSIALVDASVKRRQLELEAALGPNVVCRSK